MPPGLTGAPGEGTCAQCHTSAPNTRNGRISVDFGGLLTYTPGVKQTVTVRVHPGLSVNFATGFMASPRLASGANAGELTAGNRTIVQTNNGFQYVSQTTISPDLSFSFDWTPPAAASGNITFYFSAVAGPGDLTANAIDEVYNSTFTLRPISVTPPSGYRYTFFNLNGSTSSRATGVSSNGLVTGSFVSAGKSRGFIRAADGSITAFDVPASTNTYPLGINASGVVVGGYDNTNGQRRGFLRRADGTFATYEQSGLSTEVTAINDAGLIVGRLFNGTISSGVRLNASLQATGNLTYTATGISGTGFLTGIFPQVDTARYGYITTTDNYTQQFATICGATPTSSLTGFGINENNEVVGFCTNTPDNALAYSYSFLRLSDARTVILGDQSLNGTSPYRAYGINNSGVIAGAGGETAYSEPRAMIASPCTASLTPANFTANNGGGTVNVPVNTTSDCDWIAFTDSSWATVSTSGAGNNMLVNVQPNLTGTARTARITIGATSINVVQEAQPCSFTLSETSALVNSFGSNGVITFIAPTSCAWNITTDQPSWITFASATQGVGSGQIYYNVAQNNGVLQRNASITIGSSIFTVSQLGSATCNYQVSVSTLPYSSTAGTGTATVTTGDGCSWVASSGSTFLSIDGNVRIGSGTINFQLAANTTGADRVGTLFIANQTISITQSATLVNTGLRFVPVTPCRIADTRAGAGFGGSFGPPTLTAGTTRDFPLPSSSCGIPGNARAVSLNVTAVPQSVLSFLTAYPTGIQRPLVSTLNSFNGRVVANAAVVPTGTNGSSGSVSVYVSDTSDVILDVNGYFVPLDTPNSLVFYPVTPCRIADTRTGSNKSGAFGPPSLAAGVARTIPVTTAGCNIPFGAQAFSLNVTAVPPGPLSFVTVWPANQARPNVSTLNSFDGQVVANAAIVPSGTVFESGVSAGAINVYASNNTDLVIDVNGYFAPSGFGFNGLNFYTLAPCRAVDTRGGSGKTGSFGAPALASGTSRDFPLLGAGCNVPNTAQAYSLNMTAVPAGSLPYVSIWPTGLAQPLVSTLNSFNGQVVANAALVPATGGSVTAFAAGTTDLILDLNGYFAP
ncbi:MAG: hypothetical protein JNK87_10955 [Bryobacterales bacterium]|nr:hypothetical protein [Bryobacterales bacterium]